MVATNREVPSEPQKQLKKKKGGAQNYTCHYISKQWMISCNFVFPWAIGFYAWNTTDWWRLIGYYLSDLSLCLWTKMLCLWPQGRSWENEMACIILHMPSSENSKTYGCVDIYWHDFSNFHTLQALVYKVHNIKETGKYAINSYILSNQKRSFFLFIIIY